MAISNRERVGRGLEILNTGLMPYVMRELKSRYGKRWWTDGVEAALQGAVGREAMIASGTEETRFTKLDVQALLVIMWDNWNQVFHDQLGHVGRSYVSELREVRNRWAHQKSFAGDDAHRALDTMARLLEMTGAEGEEELREIARDLLRKRYEDETRQELKKGAAVIQSETPAGLKPWREIATPHPDVASGHYQQAEFAADLFQVINNRAEKEYQDPREFFQRTYLTEGLSRLLSRSWERLAGVGGDPVVELQTNFGGGKTHSMIALYHLFGGEIQIEDLSEIEALVPEKIKNTSHDIPKAHRAVLVGTQLSPADPLRKPDGTLVNTLWGEMVWQLGQTVGKGADAYSIIAKDDQNGVSPGSEKLALVFERFGPALVLIDEWVAFARQIYGKEHLSAGNFDANMTFTQAITEAAKAVRNVLVVASIPASDIEIGGEGGRAALERIHGVFHRIESPWKPATATESFEIVRRRLFQPINNYAARDAVCRAFSELYQTNRAEFPSACREAAYEARMCSAYPLHPELFDRLYEDWSTLEKFQRTRGVLRLMAAIIHNLWERQDQSLLIMPGTIPLDSTPVRFEITSYLSEGWGAVLDKDVDGPQSRPMELDRANPNLGRYSACRRAARTVFIGSAPSVSAQRVRGIEEVRVKLGCVQPGESPAVYGDALRRNSEELTYLYSDASRYWFDTHPTITRIASDRGTQYSPHIVEDEIIRRLRSAVKNDRDHDFMGVHPIPSNSADVPDEPECRLVILGPDAPHRTQSEPSKAQIAAQEILERRGNSPRIYRNMLVFLAPNGERLVDLGQAVRLWLAWTSIQQEEEQLNLDAAQKRQVTNQINKYDETIEARLSETYYHLLIPTQEGTGSMEWIFSRVQSGDGLVSRASKRLIRDEELINKWSAATLRIELDRWLWKDQDHLSVKQLWEYLASYLYLPRLRDEQVLMDAISDGAGSLTWQDYFAYASAVQEDGHYIGLIAGSLPNVILDSESVIVKPELAKRQREEELLKKSGDEYVKGEKEDKRIRDGEEVIAEGEDETRGIVLRRFHGSVELNPIRLGTDAGRIADEIVSHLAGLIDSDVQVVLEINAEVASGIPDDVIRILSENCNTLKFISHEFEEE